MMLLWVLAGVSLAVAVVAWTRARRTSRRLEQLTEMYWELKYQHGELRVQVQRQQGPVSDPGLPPERPATEGFIPLASLKR